MLRLTNNGRAVEEVWKNDVDNQMGSAIRVGNYIYTSGHRGNSGWFCIDWNTGEIMYRVENTGECNVIFADGMLYVYSDKGIIKLIRPNPEKYELVSNFEIRLGTGTHWSHPVIHNGVMYVRHGNTLMAYNLKNNIK